MEPTGDWDRDEILERIPWKHLSRDLGRFSMPPLLLVVVGVAVILVVGTVMVFGPASTPPAEAVARITTVPVVVPASTLPVVVTLPSTPISEADLFAEPPGAGELRAMTLAESHVRSVMSSDSVYVEWTSSFEVSRVGDQWWVDVMAGVLRVEEGVYLPMGSVALRVGVDTNGVVWSTPIESVEPGLPPRRIGGADINPELLSELSAAVAGIGVLVEVVDAGLEAGSLWGLVLVETSEGVSLTLEVWPSRQ